MPRYTHKNGGRIVTIDCAICIASTKVNSNFVGLLHISEHCACCDSVWSSNIFAHLLLMFIAALSDQLLQLALLLPIALGIAIVATSVLQWAAKVGNNVSFR